MWNEVDIAVKVANEWMYWTPKEILGGVLGVILAIACIIGVIFLGYGVWKSIFDDQDHRAALLEIREVLKHNAVGQDTPVHLAVVKRINESLGDE